MGLEEGLTLPVRSQLSLSSTQHRLQHLIAIGEIRSVSVKGTSGSWTLTGSEQHVTMGRYQSLRGRIVTLCPDKLEEKHDD